MNTQKPLSDSLDSQHHEIDARLESVLAAGRSGRWPEYRLHLSGLREGLLQHMAFEDEALYPVLDAREPAAVRALRQQHAELRRHLDMLGAAAPEQDPEGCLAVLESIAALLAEHHAAELALDPQYATRPIPPLGRAAARGAPAMDLRGLQPPEPIVRIFQALERSPNEPVRAILPHEPVPLYGLLAERGYSYAGAARADGGYELLIEKP